MSSLTLEAIARALAADTPNGLPARTITGVSSLESATASDLSFLTDASYLRQLASSKAAAVIVSGKIKLTDTPPCPVLIVPDAELALADVLTMLEPPIPRPAAGVAPSARIDPTADIGSGSAIAAGVTVGKHVSLGARCILHPGVVIEDHCKLGDDCELFANVVIRHRTTIGHRVIIHAGAVIGTDGFGYRWNGKAHRKIPHIGTVVIGDDVEIGSCSCIDRAKFATTFIGSGTKIDNLVQIGHNVTVGRHCIIVGQAGLAGSSKLGDGVVLGGQSAVRDHVTLGDGAMLAACSGVMEDVAPRQVVSGLPALPHRQSLREQAALRRLPDLVVQVRKLEEEIRLLKQSAQGTPTAGSTHT